MIFHKTYDKIITGEDFKQCLIELKAVSVSVSFISVPPVKKKTQTTTIDHTTPSRTRKRKKQQNAEHYIMQ